MLLKIRELSEENTRMLMDVYRESNTDNIKYFYPEVIDIEIGRCKVEKDYVNYLKSDFLIDNDRCCYVWEENGIWASALRFYKIKDKMHYLEALETHPDYRQKGFAEKLICGVIEELKLQGDFEIKSYTGKRNVASQRTHEKCGFRRVDGKVFDYSVNEYIENVINYTYSYEVKLERELFTNERRVL